ncbi:integral membrane protein [Ilyonectria robusta]
MSNSGSVVVLDPATAAESNVGRILAVTTTFHFLALTSVGLRLYVRLGMVKAAGRDDWTMMASGLCAFIGWLIFVLQSFHGLGRHRATIEELDYIEFQKVGFWQSIISATCAMALLKISIALNLLRLSQSKWYFWSLWSSIVFVSAYSFMGMMTFFLHCQPMAAHWDTRIDGKCYPLTLFIQFSLINTSFNIFTDVLFATFPVPIIWTLQMKLRTRLYLIGILSLGHMAVVMGILKAIFQIAFATDTDKSFLQLNLGMIAACAPSLKPLVSKALKLSSYYNSTPYGNRSYGAHPRRLTGGGRTPGNVSNFSRNNDFELGDRRLEGDGVAAGETGVTTTFYKNDSSDGGNRSGSEEMILGDGPFKAGIVRTTEVTIQR